MTYIVAVLSGAVLACSCVWLGFLLARTQGDAPVISMPEHDYEGVVLDYSVYEASDE